MRISDWSSDVCSSDLFEVNQRRGVRWSAASAFLKPAAGRPNLHVMTGARVSRVVFQNRRAAGVAFRLEDGAEKIARERAEVILAAGAIGSQTGRASGREREWQYV